MNSLYTKSEFFLAFKIQTKHTFGPQGRQRKYPLVVLNKTIPPGSFSSVEEFFSKPIQGSKNFRSILHRLHNDFPTDPWEKNIKQFLD